MQHSDKMLLQHMMELHLSLLKISQLKKLHSFTLELSDGNLLLLVIIIAIDHFTIY